MTTSRKLRTAVAGALAGGQQSFMQNGTFSFVVPADVTSISAVCVGAGGGGSGSAGGIPGSGGGAGALAYSNSIPVTPGETLTVVVGTGGAGSTSSSGSGSAGGDSSISRGATTLVMAKGGSGGVRNVYPTAGGSSASSIGDVRQNGGEGNVGGGGAAGYSGAGGNGALNSNTNGGNGSGGGAGGGSRINFSPNNQGSSGGAVGLYGEGASGAGGTFSADAGGRGGSGGQDGLTGIGSTFGTPGATPGSGAGGLIALSGQSQLGARGGHGGVRIIWGQGRSFPSTRTQDIPFGVRTKNTSFNTSTIQIPASTKVGDLIVFAQHSLGNNISITLTNPSDFTIVDSFIFTAGTFSCGAVVSYKIADTGDAGRIITGMDYPSDCKTVMVYSTGDLFSTWTPTVGSLSRQTISSAGTAFTPQTVSSGSVTSPVITIGYSNLYKQDGMVDVLNTSPIPIQDRTMFWIPTNGFASFGTVLFPQGIPQNITYSTATPTLNLPSFLLSFYIKVN